MGTRSTAQWRPSIRSRLLIATGCALLVMVLSGAGHLIMMNVAKRSAVVAFETQQRSAAYIHLGTLAREMFDATFSPDGKGAAGLDYAYARSQFTRRLDQLNSLPATSPRSTAANQLLQTSGKRIMALLDDRRQSFDALNIVRRQTGANYRQQVNLRFAPLVQFQQAVAKEIDEGDRQVAAHLKRAERVIQHVALLSAVVTVAGIIFVVLSMLVVLRRLYDGLNRFTQGAHAIAGRDFNHRLAMSGNDELSRLADVFDNMADQLGQKQRIIEETRARLEAVVQMRTGALQQANEALARADAQRRSFLAEIGHELRTPLTLIRGTAQVWLRAAPDRRSDPEDAFVRILEQGEGMGRLVDDLFIIARVDAGIAMLDLAPTDLTELVEQVTDDFSVLAEERHCTLEFQPAEPLHVCADKLRLRQVLLILLDNATTHGAGGPVIVTVAALHGEASITVSDHGPGVPEAIREQLFVRLARGEGSAGTGLGLQVAAALVHAHGGSICLDRTWATGASFQIRLPISNARKLA